MPEPLPNCWTPHWTRSIFVTTLLSFSVTFCFSIPKTLVLFECFVIPHWCANAGCNLPSLQHLLPGNLMQARRGTITGKTSVEQEVAICFGCHTAFWEISTYTWEQVLHLVLYLTWRKQYECIVKYTGSMFVLWLTFKIWLTFPR